MEKKARSGKQKVLLVLSIVATIVAIATLIFGILLVVNKDAMNALFAAANLNASMNLVLVFVDGVVVLLMGIFGILTSKDTSKVNAFLLFAWIAFIISLFLQEQTGGGLIRQLIRGGTLNPASIVSVLVDGIMVGLGTSIRNENNNA